VARREIENVTSTDESTRDDREDQDASEDESESSTSSDSSDEEDVHDRMATRLCAMESVCMPARVQREALRQEFPALSHKTVKICQRISTKIIRRMRGRNKRTRSLARRRSHKTGDDSGTGPAMPANRPDLVIQVPLINQEASADGDAIPGPEGKFQEPAIEMGDLDGNENEVMSRATKSPAEIKERSNMGQAGSLHQQPGAATPVRISQAMASSAATAVDSLLDSVRIKEAIREPKDRAEKRKRNVSDAGDTVREVHEPSREERRRSSAYTLPSNKSQSREHHDICHGTYRSSRDWRPHKKIKKKIMFRR